MKKFKIAVVCIMIASMLTSCQNGTDQSNSSAPAANSIIASSGNEPAPNDEKDDSSLISRIDRLENKVNFMEEGLDLYEQIELLSRIDKLQNELNSLREALNAEKQAKINHGAIINALDKPVYDDLYIGMDHEGGYVDAVYVKVPIVNYSSFDFFLFTGYESDGVKFLNGLIEPQINTADKYEEYGINKDKFQIFKLLTSKIKYDENSIMLIIITDHEGNEYSDYVPSLKSQMDI